MAEEVGYLLDTNAAVAILNLDTAIDQLIERSPLVSISIITLGELYFGAEKSTRTEQNIQKIEVLIARMGVIACDGATARLYAQILATLRRKGRPIPQNDVWIAATAIQHRLTLITRDAHFAEVNNLVTETW